MIDTADTERRFDLRLVPAALTAWIVTAVGILWPLGVGVALGCLVLAVFSGWTWRWGSRRAAADRDLVRVTSAVLLSAAVLGAGFGLAIMLRTNNIRDHPIVVRMGTTADVTVIPSETPRQLGTGRMLFRATLHAIDHDEIRGRVVVFAPMLGFAELAAGQPVRFHARIGKPTRRDLTVAVVYATGEPSLGQPSVVQRIAGTVRARFATQARQVLPPAQAAILPALVLGDTSAVSPGTEADFRAAGLTHLTAVSGANVTIVCGAVLFFGRLVGPRVAVALSGSALIAFVIVVQPTASVLRAAVMGAIALLAILTARRRQAIPALAATVIALMAVAPQLAVDVGFALSVSATAALVVLAPVWSRRLVARGWPKPLADAVCIAAAAQLVTAPLVAGISGTLSVVAVVANLAVAVLVAPITVLGTAAAVLCPLWPAAARLIIRFTGPELWWLLTVAHRAAAIPNATLPVPSGFVGAVVLTVAGAVGVVFWRRRWFRAACGGVVVCGLAWSASAVWVV